MNPVMTITVIAGKPIYSIYLVVNNEKEIEKAKQVLLRLALSLSAEKMKVPLYKIERDRELLEKRIARTVKQAKEVFRETRQNPVILIREEFQPATSKDGRQFVQEQSLIFPLPATANSKHLEDLIAQTPLIERMFIEYMNQPTEEFRKAVAVVLIAGSSLLQRLGKSVRLSHYDQPDKDIQVFVVDSDKKYYSLITDSKCSQKASSLFAELLREDNVISPKDTEEFSKDLEETISRYSSKVAVISDNKLSVRVIPLSVEEREESQLPERAKEILHLIEGYYTILQLI